MKAIYLKYDMLYGNFIFSFENERFHITREAI